MKFFFFKGILFILNKFYNTNIPDIDSAHFFNLLPTIIKLIFNFHAKFPMYFLFNLHLNYFSFDNYFKVYVLKKLNNISEAFDYLETLQNTPEYNYLKGSHYFNNLQLF